MGKCKDFFRGLDDKNILLHWWGSQPKGAKLGLAAAALFATLTHMAIYSNLVIEEHVLGFYKDHGPDPRWLQPYINRLSFYYLHWGTGLLQVLFIALSAFYLIKALEMKNTLVVLIFAGIMATQQILQKLTCISTMPPRICLLCCWPAWRFMARSNINGGGCPGQCL